MRTLWIAIGFAAGLIVSAVCVNAESIAGVIYAGIDKHGEPQPILVDKHHRVYVADDWKRDDIIRRLERIERRLRNR